MKPYLRFAKLFVGFLLVLAAVWILYGAYVSEEILHPGRIVDIGDRPILISIFSAAVGLAILWQDWRSKD